MCTICITLEIESLIYTKQTDVNNDVFCTNIHLLTYGNEVFYMWWHVNNLLLNALKNGITFEKGSMNKKMF